MFRRSPFLVPLMLALVTPIGFAQNVGFLKQAPIRHFNDADVKMMMGAIDAALDDPEANATREWKNADTGNFGRSTVVGSSKGPKGEPCKKLRIDNATRDAVKGSSIYTFCKPDAQWLLFSEE